MLDHNILRRQLLLANWNLVYSGNDVSHSVTQFYSIYNQCYEASCSLQRFNSRNRKRNEWVTNGLVRLVNRKNQLFRSYAKDRNNLELKNEYKNFSKTVNRQIKQAKLNFYSNQIDRCNGDSKKYWGVVKKVIKSKRKCIESITVGGKIVQVPGNEKIVSDEFNEYFTKIVPNLRDEEFGEDMFLEDQTQSEVIFRDFRLQYIDVVNKIKSMKNKYSCGLDGISIILIKENINVFTPILYDIFVKSIDEGVLPIEFKTAVVVPVFKSGSAKEVLSYRPISVINTIAKIFESLIKDKLLKYFLDRSLFSDRQFGFLPGKGTDLALDKHVSEIVTSSDKFKNTLAVYLDFKKAFDVLDIDLLIGKFKRYGIGGNALKWLVSFCRGRRQVVKINGVKSNVLELKYGTAQGGVLGPIIFLIFINDLLELQLNSKIFAYADDTALVCSAYNRDSLKIQIQNDLNKVSNWLIANKLLVNSSKTKCILFFDQNKKINELQNIYKFYCHSHRCIYECACSTIDVVDSVRYLGMIVDRFLKWDQHVIKLNKKLRQINYSLYYMKNYLKIQHLKTLYSSWFESTLRFGIIHYGGTYPTVIKSLISSQRQALRIIFNIKKWERVSYVFSEQNFLNFYQIYKQSCLLYVHKYINLFPLQVFTRQTRASQYITLKIPILNKQTSRNQFCYNAPKLFNSLIAHFGNDLLFYKKPKFKMKVIYYLKRF